MFFKLTEMWRLGHYEDPLSVSIEYQGNGRFDDPSRERTVLYGSNTIETCILEMANPWIPHPDSLYVQNVEAAEHDTDPEMQQAELDAAQQDREIAMRPPYLPENLYEKAKVYVAFSEPIVLLDLDNISVRRDLAKIPEIAAKMREHGLMDIDRSVLTGRLLDFTRAITGYLMRNPFSQHEFAGIRAMSRHEGESYALFERRYKLGTRMVGPIRLHREDPHVIEVAARLRMVP